MGTDHQKLIDWTTCVLRTRLRFGFYSEGEIEETVAARRKIWATISSHDLAEKVLAELCLHEMSGPH